MPRVSKADRDAPSEYGGQPGLVQPPPHIPTADEILHMIKRTDPDDPTFSFVIPERVKRATES
jgi:hypothetical protein